MNESKLIEMAEKMRKGYIYDDETRALITGYEIWKMGQNTILEENRDKLIAKGKVEGKIEGKIEAKTESILAMYKNGINIETIMKIMNMSKEDIEKIINNKH